MSERESYLSSLIQNMKRLDEVGGWSTDHAHDDCTHWLGVV